MASLNELLESLSAEDQADIATQLKELQRTIPLRTLREDAGMTQSALAAILGTSQAAVSRIESRTDVLLSTLFNFAKAVGARAHVRMSLNGADYTLEPHWDAETQFTHAACSFTLKREVGMEISLPKTEYISNQRWQSVGVLRNARPRLLEVQKSSANDHDYLLRAAGGI